MKKKWTYDNIEKFINNETNNEYTLITFTKYSDKMKVKHNICGNIYEVAPSHFIHNKRRCPMCSPNKK